MNTKVATKDLTLIAFFSALIAICSWISIPMTVPFTMQTFGVFITVGLLGRKRGTMAVLVYMLLGAMGVPVFAGFSGGLGILLGTTGGYIVGFLFSAIVTGFIMERFGRKLWSMIAAMGLGLVVCYAVGTAWFMMVYSAANGPVSLATTLSWCVIPFIIPDVLKLVLAVGLTKRLSPYVEV